MNPYERKAQPSVKSDGGKQKLTDTTKHRRREVSESPEAGGGDELQSPRTLALVRTPVPRMQKLDLP
jgi:hypothetical protein